MKRQKNLHLDCKLQSLQNLQAIPIAAWCAPTGGRSSKCKWTYRHIDAFPVAQRIGFTNPKGIHTITPINNKNGH